MKPRRKEVFVYVWMELEEKSMGGMIKIHCMQVWDVQIIVKVKIKNLKQNKIPTNHIYLQRLFKNVK